MKKNLLKIILTAIMLMLITSTWASDPIIFSISHTLPMGEPNEVLSKNYFINMGGNQGVTKGTTLSVFRVVSQIDPYKSKKRYNHQVKIGELEVIHVENESAIAKLHRQSLDPSTAIVEINSFMIGDKVSVSIN